jgi:hypothetical protein
MTANSLIGRSWPDCDLALEPCSVVFSLEAGIPEIESRKHRVDPVAAAVREDV